jgi:prephenate dehydratase
MRAAYLGPSGTFSEEALRAAAPELEPVPVATLRDVVLAVQRGAVERAIVPFENALEGGVDPVLDALALEAPDVALISEHVQPVVHNLVGPDGLALEEIETVLSHPQALAQCARWLAERIPHAVTVPTASTADAVREVACRQGIPRSGGGSVAGGATRRAAIGPRLAAERYGARVLASEIEDEPGNATRFALLAPVSAAPPPPEGVPAKTALVYWGAGSGSPGWLVDCLTGFASRGVNLVRIESRPLRQGMGRYMFFLDLEGRDMEPHVTEALAGLRARVEVLRVLGSFPAA